MSVILNESDIECCDYDSRELNLIFIPYFVMDKIKALNLDYKRLFDESKFSDLKKSIGTMEQLQIELITTIMLGPEKLTQQHRIYGDITSQHFDLDTKKSLFKDLVDKCGKDDNGEKCTIEKSKISVFIILNRNFLYNYELCGFEETYRNISGEICKKLFAFFNEKLIYASALFKAQYK